MPNIFFVHTSRTGTTSLPGLWSGNHSLGLRQKVPREEHSDFLVIKSGISPQRSIQSKDVKLVMATVTKPASTSSVGIKKWRWILNSYICVFMAGVFLEMVSAMEPWNEIKSLSLKPVGNKRTNFVIMDWFTLLSADWSENILDLSALFCSFHYRHFIFLR